MRVAIRVSSPFCPIKTPVDLLKMRPDLAANRDKSSNLLRSSLLMNAQTAMQVSTADLDDAGDEEGNGGRQDYPSPYGVIW